MQHINTLCGQNAEFLVLNLVLHVITTVVYRVNWSCACKYTYYHVYGDNIFIVSQTEASERLHDEGLEVVGWYHSHPTFLPNPSLQDLDTQSHMQRWFAKTASAPLVGFILSPYCPTSKTSASEYR